MRWRKKLGKTNNMVVTRSPYFQQRDCGNGIDETGNKVLM